MLKNDLPGGGGVFVAHEHAHLPGRLGPETCQRAPGHLRLDLVIGEEVDDQLPLAIVMRMGNNNQTAGAIRRSKLFRVSGHTSLLPRKMASPYRVYLSRNELTMKNYPISRSSSL